MDNVTLEYISRLAPTKEKEWSVTSKDTKIISIVALVKGSERYVFVYDDESRAETLRTLGRYASNSELSFTWYDAALVSQRIRHKFYSKMLERRFELNDEFS